MDGTDVIDSSRTIKIKVTSADVKRAKRKDPGNCAIAQSVKRCAHVDSVRVHTSRTYVRKHKSAPWERFITPMSIRTELVAFDRGAPFQEDEYTLRPMSKTRRMGERKRYYEATKRKAFTGKTRAKPHVFAGIRVSAPHGGGDKTSL